MGTRMRAPVLAPVAVSVLGPVAVRRDGTELDLGTPKQRALLAGLALWRGRAVAVDTLVDLLWGDDPPPGVATTLQGYVAGLRRVLEPGRARRAPASVLVTSGAGYALAVDESGLDAAQFEETVAAHHRLLRPLDPLRPSPLTVDALGQAAAGLDGALRRWRGEPYAELPEAPSAVAERVRLEELRLLALEDRAIVDLALGNHGSAAVELERLTGEHPLRERLWALRAIALTRAGRQAEALDVLRRVREVLDEELGLEPSAQLRELQTAVLRQDPALAWVPPASDATVAPGPAAVVVPRARAGNGDRTAGADGTAAGGAVEGAAGGAVGGAGGRAAEVAPWPMVGREDQLAGLVAALDRACAGVPSYAVLTGEPGIGKSRLGAELALVARRRGARVLAGRCSQDDGAPPLWPWKSVLGGLEQELPHVSGQDTGAAFRTWEQVCDRVLEAARAAPTVVLLDDLHWADESSLRVLRLLVEHTAGAAGVAGAGSLPLLLLVTWRNHPEPTGALADVAESLARAHAVRLELEGLPPGAAATVVAAVARREVPPPVAAALQDRTDGNPFFLVEYARLAAGRELADVLHEAPRPVTDVLGRRVARLPADTVTVLGTAALSGREFETAVVAGATGHHEDEVLDLLEPAVAAGLVRERGVDRFAFSHALVRDTLRDGLSASRRARVHARLAEVLAQRTGHETEVARHWLAAGPSYAGRAWLAAVTASQVARRLHAYAEAAELLRAALGALDDDPESTLQDRYGVLMALIEAYRWAAQLPPLVACAEEAIAVGKRLRDPAAVAHAAFAATQSVFWRSAPPGEVNETVVGALRGTLDRIPAGDSELRASSLLALGNELGLSVPLAERRALVEDGIAMAERLGDDRLVLGGCLVGNAALMSPTNAEQRLGWVTRALDLARSTGTDRMAVVAGTMRAAVLGELGRPAEMAAAAEEARAIAERLRILFGLVILDEIELPWLALSGRLEEAEERLERMRGTARDLAHPHADEAVLSVLLGLRLWQGRALEMVPILEELDTSPYPFSASVAVYLWRAGEVDRARRYVTEHGLPLDHDNEISLLAWCHTAELALRLGAGAGLLADLRSRLAPYAGRSCTAGSGLSLGPVDAYLAMAARAAGDRRAASRHADAALALTEQWRIPAFAGWFGELRATYEF